MAKVLRKRLSNMSSTYRQTLQRDMFVKQREQTDKVQRKCLKEERRRIIKSATRKNPKLLAAAIQKSKQAVQLHEEWRSIQRVKGSNSPLKANVSQQSSMTVVLSIDGVQNDDQNKDETVVSTKVRTSKYFDRSANRSSQSRQSDKGGMPVVENQLSRQEGQFRST